MRGLEAVRVMSTSISSAMAARECRSNSRVIGSTSTSSLGSSGIGPHQQVSSGQHGRFVAWQQANSRARFEHDAGTAHPVTRPQAVAQHVLGIPGIDDAATRRASGLQSPLRAVDRLEGTGSYHGHFNVALLVAVPVELGISSVEGGTKFLGRAILPGQPDADHVVLPSVTAVKGPDAAQLPLAER